MAVGFRRDAGVAVAEDPLHRARVHARHHEQACRGVAEVVEPDPTNLRLGPELHPMRWASADLVVRRELGMAAALLSTDVLPSLDDPGVGERAPQHLFERRVTAQYLATRVREHELGG